MLRGWIAPQQHCRLRGIVRPAIPGSPARVTLTNCADSRSTGAHSFGLAHALRVEPGRLGHPLSWRPMRSTNCHRTIKGVRHILRWSRTLNFTMVGLISLALFARPSLVRTGNR